MPLSFVSLANRYDAIRLAARYHTAYRGELVLHDRVGGLFSLYCQVLGALFVSDILRCSLRLRFLDGDYRTPSMGEDGWWTQFFETCVYNPERKTTGASVELPASKKSVRFAHLGVAMNRHLAHALSNRVRFRPEIPEAASAYQKSQMGGHPFIGIHYRGTDKLLSEAVRVPYASILDQLARLDPTIRFFVATDEQAFLDAIREKFGDRVAYRDHHRSTDGTPVHHFDAGHETLGYTRGQEAIMDAILLSRCNGMIRTPSNLSLASTFMDPKIPVLIFDSGIKPWKPDALSNLEQAVLNSQ